MAMRQRYAADVTEVDEEVWEISDPVTGDVQRVHPAPLLLQSPNTQEMRRTIRGGQVFNRVTVQEVAGDEVINRSYYQDRRNYQHNPDPVTTDPRHRRISGVGVKTIKTRRPVQEDYEQDERTYHVDVQRKGQKSFSFYVKIIGSAIVVGALSWFFAIAPAIHHYHVGDNPVHQYTVAMGGEKCLATATMNGEVIDIMIAPSTFKSKVHPEVQSALYKGDAGPHEITLQTDLDVNNDGRTDIIVNVDGHQVATLLANPDGSGYHWSKQS